MAFFSLGSLDRSTSLTPATATQIAVLGSPASIDAAKLAIETLSHQNAQPEIGLFAVSPRRMEDVRQFLQLAQTALAIVVPDPTSFAWLEPLLSELEWSAAPPMITSSIPVQPESSRSSESVPCRLQAVVSHPVQGEMLAAFAIESLGARTAGILVDSEDATAVKIAYRFQDTFEQNQGHGSVLVQTYRSPQPSAPLLKQLKTAHPLDVLLLPNPPDAILAQVEQAQTLGFNIPFLGANFWESFTAQEWPRLEGNFFAANAYTPTSPDHAGNLFFQRLYERSFSRRPTSIEAATYDMVSFVATVLRNVNWGDRKTPRELCRILSTAKAIRGIRGMFKVNPIETSLSHVNMIKIENRKLVWQSSVPVAKYENPSPNVLWRLSTPQFVQ